MWTFRSATFLIDIARGCRPIGWTDHFTFSTSLYSPLCQRLSQPVLGSRSVRRWNNLLIMPRHVVWTYLSGFSCRQWRRLSAKRIVVELTTRHDGDYSSRHRCRQRRAAVSGARFQSVRSGFCIVRLALIHEKTVDQASGYLISRKASLSIRGASGHAIWLLRYCHISHAWLVRLREM